MRYFLLSQSTKMVKPLVIDGLDPKYYKYNIATEADWERIPDAIVAYFQNSPMCEVPAVIKQPTLMISNDMKELFQLYDPSIEGKGIQVFSNKIEDRLAYLYWVIKCTTADCLHESCEIYPNGMVKEIKLKQERIPDVPIFKIGSILQNTLIVNFPVAESILRRNWMGVALEEIKVER